LYAFRTHNIRPEWKKKYDNITLWKIEEGQDANWSKNAGVMIWEGAIKAMTADWSIVKACATPYLTTEEEDTRADIK